MKRTEREKLWREMKETRAFQYAVPPWPSSERGKCSAFLRKDSVVNKNTLIILQDFVGTNILPAVLAGVTDAI